MTELDFKAFDADNHYYEATDAFTRHIEPAFAKRAMQWAEIDGTHAAAGRRQGQPLHPQPHVRPRVQAGRARRVLPGPQPARTPASRDLFGELEPISPAYRDRDARLAVMDEQGLDGAFFFPTLGVGMEQPLMGDPPALMAAFRAFNRWLDEDWGFAYQERIFAAPYITLVDVDNAVAELEWALDHDARIILIGVGPVRHRRRGSRSVGPDLRPVLGPGERGGRDASACTAATAPTAATSRHWGQSAEMEAFRANPAARPALARPRARHRRGHAGRPVLRPVPQHPGGLHRAGRDVGVPPVREAREGLRPGTRRLPGGSSGHVPPSRVGLARSTRTTCRA